MKIRLFTNVKALQFYHLARQGSAILTAILLAKSALGQQAIGSYEMLLYVGFLVSFFWTSGYMQGMLSIYPRLPKEEQPVFIFNTFALFLLCSILIYLVLWSGQRFFLPILTHSSAIPFFNLFLLFSALNWPTLLLENYYLLRNQPAYLYAWGMFSFGGQLVAFLGPIFLAWEFVWSFYGLIALSLLKWAWLLAYVFKNGVWRFHYPHWRKWSSLSLPLMLYAMISAVNQSFDSWLTGYLFSGDENTFAIFRYGARELPLMLAMSNAFSAAMVPEVAAHLHQGLEAIKNKSLKLLHLLFPFSIVLMLCSPLLFPLVFSEAFSASVPIFNTFLLITISRLIFSRTVLVGLEDNRLILLISILEFVVHIAAGFVFGYFWGLVGIAWGAVVAYSLEKFLICFYLYKKHGIALGQYTPLKWYGAYSLALLLSFFLSYLW